MDQKTRTRLYEMAENDDNVVSYAFLPAILISFIFYIGVIQLTLHFNADMLDTVLAVGFLLYFAVLLISYVLILKRLDEKGKIFGVDIDLDWRKFGINGQDYYLTKLDKERFRTESLGTMEKDTLGTGIVCLQDCVNLDDSTCYYYTLDSTTKLALDITEWHALKQYVQLHSGTTYLAFTEAEYLAMKQSDEGVIRMINTSGLVYGQ